MKIEIRTSTTEDDRVIIVDEVSGNVVAMLNRVAEIRFRGLNHIVLDALEKAAEEWAEDYELEWP